jgi:hypothetical protein
LVRRRYTTLVVFGPGAARAVDLVAEVLLAGLIRVVVGDRALRVRGPSLGHASWRLPLIAPVLLRLEEWIEATYAASYHTGPAPSR